MIVRKKKYLALIVCTFSAFLCCGEDLPSVVMPEGEVYWDLYDSFDFFSSRLYKSDNEVDKPKGHIYLTQKRQWLFSAFFTAIYINGININAVTSDPISYDLNPVGDIYKNKKSIIISTIEDPFNLKDFYFYININDKEYIRIWFKTGSYEYFTWELFVKDQP